MEEKLQAALAELIQKTLQGADATKDFLTAEIPDVVYQLLLWYGIYNFILFVIGMLLVIAIVYGNYKQWQYWKKQDEVEPYVMANIFQAFLFLPLTVALNLTWLQIWIAPKVWLIEYMGQLIK